MKIHYIHTKASITGNRQVIPILLLHGWPGSVRDFYDVIPMLIKPDTVLTNVVFEVVVPSLPGFGWSQPTLHPGLGVSGMAIVMRNLMIKLGYEKFYIHGGNWGCAIGSSLATIYPYNVLGFHSNTLVSITRLSFAKAIVASWWPSMFVYKKNQDFFFPLKHKLANLMQETGHLHLHASKPDTIGSLQS